MSKGILENKDTQFKMEDFSDDSGGYYEEVILSVNRIGQVAEIQTRGFSSDDFRALADYLDKIRVERSELGK